MAFTATQLQAKDPDGFLSWAKSRPDSLEVMDVIEKYSEGMAGAASQFQAIATIRSFLKRNGYAGLPSMGRPAGLKNFHPGFTRDQLQSLLGFLDDNLQKLFVLVEKDSGLRAQDALALRYRHVKKDLEAGHEIVHIEFEPLFYQRKKASGITFIGKNSTTLLRELIKEKRVSTAPEAKIFPWAYVTITEAVRLARNKAHLDPTIQPNHASRKFFEQSLDKVGMDVHRKLQLEGHSLGSRFHYTSQNVSELRTLYESAYRFLDLSEQAVIDKSVLDLKTTLENQAKTITDQTEQIKVLKAEMSKQQDLKGEIDSLRRDFAVLDDVRRRTPGLEEEFERLDKLRKRYEEKIKLFHELTKYIAQRESSSGKK